MLYLIKKSKLNILLFFSCLDKQEVIPICGDLFEVIDYPTTAFVFELAPESNLFSLTKLVMYIFMYFQECKTRRKEFTNYV